MVAITLDPTLIHLGPFALTWHGLFAALGIAGGIALSLWLARREGFPEDPVLSVAGWPRARPKRSWCSTVGKAPKASAYARSWGVDVATGWTEPWAVWGKGKQRVASGMHHIRLRLPVELREKHTDNGGESINEALYPYCQQQGIRFTQGRPYQKNDQASVEQKGPCTSTRTRRVRGSPSTPPWATS